ncbi:hypothetical protein EON63_24715 [archaeon]|nr:MAG: hypothetical protein EON63_24715 [archaeon]
MDCCTSPPILPCPYLGTLFCILASSSSQPLLIPPTLAEYRLCNYASTPLSILRGVISSAVWLRRVNKTVIH